MSWSPWSCDQRQVGAARRPRVPRERPQTPTNLPRRAGGPLDLHVLGGAFRRGGAPRAGRSVGAVSARPHAVALAHPSGPYVQPAPAPRPPPPAGPPFWLYVIFGALLFGLAAAVALAHRHFRSVVPVLDPVPDDTPDLVVDPGPPSGASGQTPPRLPSSRITLGSVGRPGDRRDEKQGGRGARAAGVQQQAPPGLIRPARASARGANRASSTSPPLPRVLRIPAGSARLMRSERKLRFTATSRCRRWGSNPRPSD